MNAIELRMIAEDARRKGEAKRRRAEEAAVVTKREGHWATAKQAIAELSEKLDHAAQHGQRSAEVFRVWEDGAMWQHIDTTTRWSS